MRYRALVLAFSCAPAWAQNAPPFPFWPQNKVRWPTGELGSCVDLTRSVAGYFTDDGVTSVVSLGAGNACFLYGPFAHVAAKGVPFPGALNDIDMVPDGGIDRRDALAGVGASGLVIAYLLGTEPDEFASDSAIEGDWLGARIVRSGRINADLVPDFVGVAADGKTVIVRQNTIGTTTYVETTFPCHQPAGGSSSVRDLVLAQLDSDAELELGLSTDFGIEVYDADGALRRKSATPGHHGDAIAAFQSAPGGPAILAWLVTNATQTGQDLYALRLTVGPALQLQGAMPFSDGFAMASADGDGDGKGDLVVTRHDTYRPHLLRNSATSADGPYFATSAAPDPTEDYGVLELSDGSVDPDLEQPASTNDSLPVWTDLSNDGVPDLLLAIEAANTFAVLDGVTLPTYPSAENASAVLFGDGGECWPWDGTTAERHVEFILEYDAVPTGANHVEVWAFIQDGLLGTEFLETSTEFAFRFPTAGHTLPYHVDVSIPIDAEEDNSCELMRVYWVGTRFTKRDETTHALIQGFPVSYGVFTTDGGVLNHWVNSAGAGGTAAWTPTVEACCLSEPPVGCSASTSLRPVPGLMERLHLPPSHTGRVPKVPGNPPPPVGNFYGPH